MTQNTDDGKAEQNQNPTKRVRGKNSAPLSERLAYTPTEFASLFGKQKVWGYRQIYKGRVKVLKTVGQILVPRSEVERILAGCEEYGAAK